MTAMILLIVLPIVAALPVGAVRKNARLLATLPLVVAGVSVLGFLLALGASPLKLAGSFVGPFTLHFELDAWRRLLLAFVCTFELMTGDLRPAGRGPGRPAGAAGGVAAPRVRLRGGRWC